jgi:hypothetical protein
VTWYAPYDDRFAAALLTALDAPVVRDTLDAVIAWIGSEAGWNGSNVAVKANHPLNIKAATFRSYGIPVDGSQSITNVDDGTQRYGIFSSVDRGAAATAEYLLRGSSHGYDKAIAALKGQDAEGFLDAVARSDWAASHYGLPKTNHLLANLAYVRRATPRSDPKGTLVKCIQLSGTDLEGLGSIAVREGTPIEDLARGAMGHDRADERARPAGAGRRPHEPACGRRLDPPLLPGRQGDARRRRWPCSGGQRELRRTCARTRAGPHRGRDRRDHQPADRVPSRRPVG